MNFKKRVNGSWTDTHYYIHNTSTDTIATLPAVLYPNGATATVGLKGNTVQNGTPTPSNPITPQGTGDRTENLWDENYTAISDTIYYRPMYVGSQKVTMSTTTPLTSGGYANLFLIAGQASSGAKIDDHGVYSGRYLTVTPINGYITVAYRNYMNVNPQDYDTMLSTGSTALPYEPYGYKIPISSASTTTPVYLGEVETTRKIKKLVLTGDGVYAKDNGGEYLYWTTENARHLNRTDCFCSHLVSTRDFPKNQEGCCTYRGDSVIYLNFGADVMNSQPSGNTSAGIKEYISAQYAAGTPVTIWCVLETEETGVVNEPLMKIGDYADAVSGISIQTISGADTLSVDTTLQPSEVTVSYRGWHPAIIHERTNGAWT